MRITQLWVVLAILLLAINIAQAKTSRIDLDTNGPNWDPWVIAVCQVPERDEKDVTSIRKVKFERILHGSWTTPGVYPVDFGDDDIFPMFNLKSGYYILICCCNNNRLICGYGSISLGPIKNYLAIGSPTAPEVCDVMAIVDTARISIPGVKLQRINEMMGQMIDRPLVLQYCLSAQVNALNHLQKEVDDSLQGILENSERFDTASVIQSDRLYVGIKDEKSEGWRVSDKRKLLFGNLQKTPNIDKDSKEYIDTILHSFVAK